MMRLFLFTIVTALLMSGCAPTENQSEVLDAIGGRHTPTPRLEFLEYQELQRKNPFTKGALGILLFDEHEYVVMLDYVGNPVHFVHNPECPAVHN